MRFLFTVCLTLILSITAYAQKGHEIKVKIDGYEGNVLYLAYHYGSKQYIKDTVYRTQDKSFIFFDPEESLPPGNYFVVIPPENKYVDILINNEEQHFSIQTANDNTVQNTSFGGQATDNRLFYKYLSFLNEQRTKHANASKITDETEKANALENLDNTVKAYQDNLIKDNPETITTLLVKSGLSMDYPDFDGNEEEIETKKWRYTQKHYFDNFDLTNDALLRTSFIESKVEYYIDKLQVHHPDTISFAIDQFLSMLPEDGELFKYFTVHFLNKYATSKFVGMDAVYVHIAEKYYKSGKASWTDPEQLEKIVDTSNRLKPFLIGEIAPDLKLQKKDGSAQSIYDIESEYAILYFWRYDCGHCKDANPALQTFYEEYKDQGVEVIAICTKEGDELKGCWDYVDESGYNGWIHLADPNNQSGMSTIYDIRALPQVFVLDKDKRILSKRIDTSQLDDVFNYILEKN